MSGDKTGCEISAPASASLSSQTVSLPDPAAAAQTLYSPHTLSFFLLLLLLPDFHLFSTSLVSLLSCHFAVGGQWLGARCVLGQLPPALHKRHANCRCGLLAAAKWGVLRPTLWEQTPQLFFAHNYLTSSQSVRNSMFFSDTKTSPWANCVAKVELCFCADTFRQSKCVYVKSRRETDRVSARQASFTPILSAVARTRRDGWQNLLLWLSAQETGAKNTGGAKHRDKVENSRYTAAAVMVCRWHMYTHTHRSLAQR